MHTRIISSELSNLVNHLFHPYVMFLSLSAHLILSPRTNSQEQKLFCNTIAEFSSKSLDSILETKPYIIHLLERDENFSSNIFYCYVLIYMSLNTVKTPHSRCLDCPINITFSTVLSRPEQSKISKNFTYITVLY